MVCRANVFWFSVRARKPAREGACAPNSNCIVPAKIAGPTFSGSSKDFRCDTSSRCHQSSGKRMNQPDELKRDEPLVWSAGRGIDVWNLFCACIVFDLEEVRQLL